MSDYAQWISRSASVVIPTLTVLATIFGFVINHYLRKKHETRLILELTGDYMFYLDKIAIMDEAIFQFAKSNQVDDYIMIHGFLKDSSRGKDLAKLHRTGLKLLTYSNNNSDLIAEIIKNIEIVDKELFMRTHYFSGIKSNDTQTRIDNADKGYNSCEKQLLIYYALRKLIIPKNTKAAKNGSLNIG